MYKGIVERELKLLGLKGFENHIFYNCRNGLRFEIGTGNVYGFNKKPRKKYMNNALERVLEIYRYETFSYNLLVWKSITSTEIEQQELKDLFAKFISQINPCEEFSETVKIEGELVNKTCLYWDIEKTKLPMEILFKEIILGDIGGCNEFVSSLYIIDSKKHTLFHLYDDRGLDIVSKEKSTLTPIYEKFTPWILEYHFE